MWKAKLGFLQQSLGPLQQKPLGGVPLCQNLLLTPSHRLASKSRKPEVVKK